jgi:hypothetical protein
MKMLMAAVALTAAIALPPIAASGQTPEETYAAKQTVKKAKHARVVKRVRSPRAQVTRPEPFSPFVHKPEYDVYVDGEYAGSDPDPLVRLTLQREWRCSRSKHC